MKRTERQRQRWRIVQTVKAPGKPAGTERDAGRVGVNLFGGPVLGSEINRRPDSMSEQAREAAQDAVQQVVYYDDFPNITKEQGQQVADAAMTAYEKHLREHPEEIERLLPDSKVIIERGSTEALVSALADCVVKATPYGEQDGGFIASYILPTGPLHRAMPLLEQLGVVVRPGFDGRLISD